MLNHLDNDTTIQAVIQTASQLTNERTRTNPFIVQKKKKIERTVVVVEVDANEKDLRI